MPGIIKDLRMLSPFGRDKLSKIIKSS